MGSCKKSAKVGIWANNSNLSQLKMQEKKGFIFVPVIVYSTNFPSLMLMIIVITFALVAVVDCIMTMKTMMAILVSVINVIHNMDGCAVADCKT